MVVCHSSFAQIDLLQVEPFEEKPLIQFIEEIEAEYNVRFFFKEEWIKDITISNQSKQFLAPFISSKLSNRGISVLFRGSSIILYLQKDYYFVDPSKVSEDAIVIGENKPLAPLDQKVRWQGQVINGKNGSPLTGVTIKVGNGESGTSSDTQGNFDLGLTPGLYEVSFSYVDFEPTVLNVMMRNDGKLDIELYEKSELLDEVVIMGEATDVNVNSTSIGTDKLDIEVIEKIPAFLGEVDVVKSLLLLPGVSTVGEGAAGFNVRGGSTDQNLVLFDGATVYNSSHLFGFFSNFNPDVVDRVTLYKGGVPAAYGDRISSVLDVQSKQLTHEKFKLYGGLGLVSSRMVAEIPVVKDKSSILVGGRITYSDWILKEINDLEIQKSRAQFYDANLKWTTDISRKDKITLSTYISNDEFKFAADTLYSWHTQNAVISWDHLFSNKFSVQATAAYVDYGYQVEGLSDTYSFELTSGLNDISAGLNLFYTPKASHSFSGGAKYNIYRFVPGELKVKSPESNAIPTILEEEQSREIAGYLQHEFKVNHNFAITTGLRYSRFENLGPGNVLTYAAGQSRSSKSVVNTKSYGDNEVIATYDGLEPRLSLKYSLSAFSSLKFGYNHILQYIQVISNTTSVTPVDIWKSSDYHIKPQIGDQISLGYFLNLRDNSIETSAEVYYKEVENVADYKDGARILLNKAIEQELITGQGRSYGLELFLKKKTGRLTGWFSYTYSRSERKMRGPYKEEVINNGDFYPSNFDQPHSISIVTDYQITKRWSFGANFIFNSGRPVTAPEAKFVINGTQVAYFSERNQYRIPNYHRLDLSVTLKGGHRKKKILNGDWIFSIYNLYGRQNAYSVYFKHEEGSPPQAYKLSVLGTMFPSLTYNFSL